MLHNLLTSIENLNYGRIINPKFEEFSIEKDKQPTKENVFFLTDYNIATTLESETEYKLESLNNSGKVELSIRKELENELGASLLSKLYDVVNNHPDKDLILEMYQKESSVGADGIVSISTGGGCRCGCVGACRNRNRYSEYMNFIGEESVRSSSVNNQTNAFIMASALLLGAAILAKKL